MSQNRHIWDSQAAGGGLGSGWAGRLRHAVKKRRAADRSPPPRSPAVKAGRGSFDQKSAVMLAKMYRPSGS